jgi:hypothetical protein
VLNVRVPYGLDLLWGTLSLSGELVQCQSNHDVYVFSRSGLVISGGDGMDINS